MPGESQVRWQWFTSGRWKDFAAGNSSQIERLFRKGEKARSRYLRVWEDGMERDIDMWHMKTIPGQGKLRRIGPPVSVPGRPHLADVTVPPSYSNQQTVDDEGSTSEAARQKPKRNNSAPIRRSVPNRKANVPTLGNARQVGSGVESAGDSQAQRGDSRKATPAEDLTKFNIASELWKLCHPDFRMMQEVQFHFKELPRGRPSAKKNEEDANVICDIVKLAEEYGQCLREGEPLALTASATHTLAAVSIALHMTGPYQDTEAADRVPLAATASPQPVLSSASSERLSLGFQGHAGKALRDFFQSRSRRPASAPARTRSHSELANQLVDVAPRLVRPSMISGDLPELPARIVFRVGRDSQEVRQQARKLRDAWREWQEFSLSRQNTVLHALPAWLSNGRCNHTWVTTINSLPRCLDRLQCLLETLSCARDLKRASEVADEIRFLRHSEHRPRSAVRLGKSVLDLKKTHLSSLSQAVICSSGGRRSAAVIICSPYEVGARCFTGRIPCGEEEACLRSTFYCSLREAARQVRLQHSSDFNTLEPHIPDDGALLCEKVLVLRDDAQTGYAPYRVPIQVCAVIAVSMPTDTGSDKATISGAMTNKISTILKAADELEVDALVLTDEGAGPHAVAWASATATRLDLASKGREPLPEVYLAGSEYYKNTARQYATSSASEW